jgi:hypothetical protein
MLLSGHINAFRVMLCVHSDGLLKPTNHVLRVMQYPMDYR